MSKLICSTSECAGNSIKLLISGTQENDVPVVAILSLEHVAAAAHAQFEHNGYPPKLHKLHKMREKLTPGGTLNVPWIEPTRATEDPQIWFSDGRHRSLILREKGYQTVPVGTVLRYAEALRAFWGSQSTAKQEYSFEDCDLPIVGLP